MDAFLNQSMNQFGAFLLITARVGGLLIFAPIFGSQDVPRQVRGWMVLLVAFLLVGVLPATALPDVQSWSFFALVPTEALVGILLAFASSMIFAGVQLSGDILGMHIGFRFGTLVDPTASEEVSLLAQFQYLLASLIFIIIGGHRWVIEALGDSYRLMPPGTAHFAPGVEIQLMNMASTIFVIAIKICAPVLLSMLLSNFALGIISRTVPQINILNIGFIITILFGLGVMLLTMEYFGELMLYLFDEYRRDMLLLWRLFS